ncbi:MAG: hypothetical protein KKI09_01095 [Spirochaetes bacterium]|nr:hypothetical protein [Spirochaetota bacterium]
MYPRHRLRSLNRGYDLSLVADAHSCEDLQVSDEKTLFAADLILELNIGIQYVEYPGITTRVLKSVELTF